MINPYWTDLLLLAEINIIFAISLNLVLGYNGQFSLGHAGFLAIGAYASGVATAAFGWPLWAGILLAIALNLLAAVIIGYPCLRMRGDYLAIATLGFGEIIRIALIALPRDTFGGPTGMRNVHKLWDYFSLPSWLNGPGNLLMVILAGLLFVAICGWGLWAGVCVASRWLERLRAWSYYRWTLAGAVVLVALWRLGPLSAAFTERFQFSAAFSQPAQENEKWAALVLYGLLLFAVLRVCTNYLGSIAGRNVVAIREDEVAASNLGVNVPWMKLQNFALSASLAGIAGAMLAHTQELFRPVGFGFFRSVEVLLMVVLGGMGSLTGSFIGGLLITVLPEVLRFLGPWRLVIYSLLLILFMIFKPSGLFGTGELRLPRFRNPRLAKQAGGSDAAG